MMPLFLGGHARHIRSRLYPLLEKLPMEESRDMRHLLWRGVGGGIEEARADIGGARTLAELVEYFRAAVPALADLYMAQAFNEADMRFMADLKQFAGLAFKDSIMASDLEFLSQGSEALKGRGLVPYGDLLAYFVKRIHELGP